MNAVAHLEKFPANEGTARHRSAKEMRSSEMTLPENCAFVDKAYAREYLLIVMKGEVKVFSARVNGNGGGLIHRDAPAVLTIPAGTQSTVLALKDSAVLFVHSLDGE